ncbi:MAG: ABC transporter transmembrane domain-containing protein [Candidatus Borkfalkia sp.]
MRRYFKYLKEYKWHCIFGPLLKWIEAALELMVPLVMKQIIDVGVANGDIPYVLKYGGVMLAMGALGLGCAVFCQRVASIASQGFGTNVRNALFSHINTLSYREIDKVGSASLVTRVVNDVNQMQSAVAIILRLVVRAPFIAAGAIVLCMITDWQIGLLVTLVSVLVGLVLFIITEKERAVLRDQSKKTRQNVADHQRKFRGRPRGARLFQARQRARAVRRCG